MASTSENAHARRLFAGLGRRYDLMGAVMSLGQDARWRAELVGRLPAGSHLEVLDVATGTGLVARRLAALGHHVTGVDQSPEMLETARERHPTLALIQARAEDLPFPDESFDAVTFTYLLRYVEDAGATLAELTRVLRPGGWLACLEFGVPPGRIEHAAWVAYTRVGLPVIGRLASHDWYRVGRFLGPSIEGFYRDHPLTEQRGMWENAGLGDLRLRSMSFGAGIVISGVMQQ